MKFLRHLLGITKLDKEKKQSIREKTGARNIVVEIKQYQKKWLQHVQRMDTNRIPRQALKYRPEGRRNIGRPKKRWRDQPHFKEQGTHLTLNEHDDDDDNSMRLNTVSLLNNYTVAHTARMASPTLRSSLLFCFHISLATSLPKKFGANQYIRNSIKASRPYRSSTCVCVCGFTESWRWCWRQIVLSDVTTPLAVKILASLSRARRCRCSYTTATKH